jgi:glycosyltransferase involved in cell wall biosynthesis
VFGRQVAHKRIDLAVQACNEAGVKLVVIGNGPEHERLERMAGPTISFKTRVADNEMKDHLSRAEAFIFPNEEDFGIVSAEAQAAGLPVIAYRAGGALDTVKEGVTGEFFDKQTPNSLAKKIQSFNYKLYNRQTIIDNANQFSYEVFSENIKKVVQA